MGINFNTAADAFKAVANADDALDAVIKVASESAGKIAEGRETQLQENELGAFVINKRLDKTNVEKNPPINKKKDALAGQERIKPPGDIKEMAEGFQGKHPQLKGAIALENLKSLPGKIQNAKTPQDIIDLVVKSYPNDAALASDIFDFLEEASLGDLKELVKQAKQEFRLSRGGDSNAARVASSKLQEIEEKGIPATSLEDIATPEGEAKNSLTAFEDFSKKYHSLKDIEGNVSALLHIIGEIPKAEKSGIDRAFLINLGKEGQALQDVLAAYRLHEKSIKQFEKQALMKGVEPPSLSTEVVTKAIMQMISDPRISPEKIVHYMRSALNPRGML